MTRVGSATIVVLVLVLAPVNADAQFVLRDDTTGWGWLAVTEAAPRAIVQLVFGSPQSGDQGRLDARVLSDLRSMGVRRVWSAQDFEPSESQVLGECAALDYTPPGSEAAVFGIHTEVSYWDHNRLAATEIFESITLSRIEPTDLATDTFVDTCVEQLSAVLVRLGYDEG